MGAHFAVDVIIPWHEGGNPDRARNLTHVKKLWAQHFPDWTVRVGSRPGHLPWNKAWATDVAVYKSTADVLVVADADVWLHPHELLREYTEEIGREGGWTVPHNRVWRLTEEATQEWMGEMFEPSREQLARATYRGVRGGGMFIIRRQDFDRVGGFDHRFEGWGWEDSCFGYVADTLVGARIRGDGSLVHLFHEPHPTRKFNPGRVWQDGQRAKYLRAKGFRIPMEALVRDLIDSKLAASMKSVSS